MIVDRKYLVLIVPLLVGLYVLFINGWIASFAPVLRHVAAVVRPPASAGAGPSKPPPKPPRPVYQVVATGGNQTQHVGGTTPPSSPEELARFVKAGPYIKSILDPADTSIDRLTCPPINETRYGYLRPKTNGQPPAQRQYLIALNLRQCIDLLPRLLGSVVEALRFLGPEHIALSIVEGNSDDGTLEVLRLLVPELEHIGVPYWLASSAIDPSKAERIPRLAMLRALAIEPVTGPAGLPRGSMGDGEGGEIERQTAIYYSRPNIVPTLPLTPDATVVFLNDVTACAEDILELIHQRLFQSAVMTCGMDWNNPWAKLKPNTNIPVPGTPAIFYDVWISRSMGGGMFFDIPPKTGTWERSSNLFFDHKHSRLRFDAGLPLQVFSCWNGGIAIGAEPLARGDVAFRGKMPDECHQGEPSLLCKDLWFAGHGKIAVIPAVNFEYNDERGRWLKGERGYVSDFASGRRMAEVDDEKELIVWQEQPPDMVNCVRLFTDQEMMPWNESLV